MCKAPRTVPEVTCSLSDGGISEGSAVSECGVWWERQSAVPPDLGQPWVLIPDSPVANM